MTNKKEIRRLFREACFKRDNYMCRKCGIKANNLSDADELFDAHHIISRKNMPNGGYVVENGISLCSSCHIKAEQFYVSGKPLPGYSINDLFMEIGSTYEKAFNASLLLR